MTRAAPPPLPIPVAGQPGPARRPRPFLLAVGLLVVVVGCLVVYYGWREVQPRIGRHVPAARCPVAGLPASATDVSYYVGGAFGPSTMYEFSVPEADFVRWAQANGWTLSRPTPLPSGEPWSIRRFGRDTNDPADPKDAEIVNGWMYEWVNPQRDDDRLWLGYDSDSHRAYYVRSYR